MSKKKKTGRPRRAAVPSEVLIAFRCTKTEAKNLDRDRKRAGFDGRTDYIRALISAERERQADD